MLVSDIMNVKGHEVKTILSGDTALCLAKRLRSERVGALVVSDDGQSLDGIISERDLAYGLAVYGAELHGIAVSELMTKSVITCSAKETIVDVMQVMTQRRVRHLPVMDGKRLIGLISIGDVLKHRLGEMQLEANVLRDYAIANR